MAGCSAGNEAVSDNGKQPAFPIFGVETDFEGDGSGAKFPHTYSYEKDAGLTKRELFAAMAMQGAIAARANPSALGFESHKIATEAVECADELLAALQRITTDSR
jgi:hypothetical protein